jgi:hypothetical protein
MKQSGQISKRTAAVRHGGRPGLRAAATFQCSAGDRERHRRCGSPSWSVRRRQLAPAATSSGGMARRSLAPKAAATFRRWRRGTQGTRARGGARLGGGVGCAASGSAPT